MRCKQWWTQSKNSKPEPFAATLPCDFVVSPPHSAFSDSRTLPPATCSFSAHNNFLSPILLFIRFFLSVNDMSVAAAVLGSVWSAHWHSRWTPFNRLIPYAFKGPIAGSNFSKTHPPTTTNIITTPSLRVEAVQDIALKLVVSLFFIIILGCKRSHLKISLRNFCCPTQWQKQRIFYSLTDWNVYKYPDFNACLWFSIKHPLIKHSGL